MAKSQNDAWGLGYIDLYLIHFPCALKYVDPAVIRFPVGDTSLAGFSTFGVVYGVLTI